MQKQTSMRVPTSRGISPFKGSFGLTDRERGLLALLRQAGPCSRASLIKSSGLTGPAVFRATEELAAKGFIEIGEAIASGRGQPSNEVRLNPSAAFSLGVSVTSDFAEAAIMDMTGQIIATQDVTAANMALEPILDAISNFLATFLSQGLNPDGFAGIGLAVAGFFIGDGQKLNPVMSLEDWASIELGPIFEARFGVPVIVENIASAAAMGESLIGAGQNVRSFGYVNFALGFGGGIILDGQLWRGKSGNAGEIGALLDPVGAFVPSLESLRVVLNEHGSDLNSINALLNALDQHEHRFESPLATWVEKAATSIALLGELINACIDVEALVLGGRLPPFLAIEIAQRATQKQMENRKPIRRGLRRPSISIIPAQISDRSAVVGAAALPLASRVFRPVTNL